MCLNCLCYGDGLDAVDAVKELETIFQIKIENAEAEKIQNVGDLFGLIIAKCPPSETGKCASAMAFYRLRQALGRSDLAPSSDITYLNRLGAKSALQRLAQQTGLTMPQSRFARLGQSGCTAAIVSCISAIIIACTFVGKHPDTGIAVLVGLVVVMVAGIFAARRDKGLLPHGCEALGGLVRQTVSASYGELVRRGARAREAEMWAILTTILAAFSTMPATEINRATTFYKSQHKVAA